MKAIINLATGSLLSLLLASCEKKELPVPAHDPGNVLTAVVEMDPAYKWQVYFSLKTNSVVGKNLKTAWDIGFETTPQGYHVILNAAKSMFALNTGKTDFADVSFADTTGFAEHKLWDSPTGSPDSTSIGNWPANPNVFILDRGYNEAGQFLGLQKVQFLSVNDSTYAVSFAALYGTAKTTLTIRKDSAYNFSYLSFDNGGQAVMVEPPKTEWDIAFSQYTHIFYNPVIPYLVTGCLLNRHSTSAARDSATIFSQITHTGASSLQLSTAVNVIGYEWKSFTGSAYITNTKMNFIIKDQNGLYYKMHFIDFYNSSGVKGNPKWEYQRL